MYFNIYFNNNNNNKYLIELETMKHQLSALGVLRNKLNVPKQLQENNEAAASAADIIEDNSRTTLVPLDSNAHSSDD